MKLYKDEHLNEEIVNTINFGRVEAGEKKQVIVWLHNDTSAFVEDILVTVDNSEVKVVDSPTELISYETQKIILEWDAKVDIKAGLGKTSINIFRKEIYG